MIDGTLVTISLVFPTPDRAAVADLISPAMAAAVAAGGHSVNVGVQSYEYDEDGEA